MEPEPQKNGKTINWCTVDVGDANGTGEPQGIVCGAHNFAVGRPRGRRAPRRRAARRLRDLRAQDLRPRLRRDDLLHQGARPRRGPRRASSCCPPTPASPATTSSTCCTCATRSSSSRSTPTAPTRCRCAGSRARRPWRTACPSTTPPTATRLPPTRQGYPVVVEDAEGCPVFVARTVTGFDPTAPTPSWMARRLLLLRPAPDLAGRRRHQLRDVRARPPDPRLRRRQAQPARSASAARPRASG